MTTNDETAVGADEIVWRFWKSLLPHLFTAPINVAINKALASAGLRIVESGATDDQSSFATMFPGDPMTEEQSQHSANVSGGDYGELLPSQHLSNKPWKATCGCREAITSAMQRLNESGTGEIGLVDTIHATHHILGAALAIPCQCYTPMLTKRPPCACREALKPLAALKTDAERGRDAAKELYWVPEQAIMQARAALSIHCPCSPSTLDQAWEEINTLSADYSRRTGLKS